MIEWINIEDQQPTDDDLNKAVAVDDRGQYFILRELCIVTLKGGEIRYISHSTKEFMDVLVGNAEPSTLDDVTHIVAWAPLQRPEWINDIPKVKERRNELVIRGYQED
jgi:hypothetical protein